MAEANSNIQIPHRDIDRHYTYLKRRMKTPKISRLKLKDEFASKGWTTCSGEFQRESGESEYDIVSSPTKYPASSHNVVENCPKKKPMFVEISNIESTFFQNKFNSSKLEVNRKFHQSIYDFVPKVNNMKKLNLICHRKRINLELSNLKNIQTSFQNKKQCTESLNSSKSNISLIADSNPIKISTSKKINGLNSVSEQFKNLSNGFNNKYSYEEYVNKDSASDILIKDKYRYVSTTSANVPTVSASVPFIKENQNENFRPSLSKNESLGPKLLNQNLQVSQSKHHCDKSANSNNTINVGYSSSERNNFKDDYKNHLSDFSINNSSLTECLNENFKSQFLIEDYCSPVSCSSMKVFCTSTYVPFTNKNTDYLNDILKKSGYKRLCSESFNLQELQESFQGKKTLQWTF